MNHDAIDIPQLTRAQRDDLLDIAEASIAHGVRQGAPLGLADADLDGWLAEPRATFVTTYLDDELAGCIGSLAPTRPLGRDVCHNAFMAAFRDPRFAPMRADDLPHLDVHISVLSPLRALPIDDEAHLIRLLEPGTHGLVLDCEGRRGTLLPSVWEQCPDPARFVGHVKRKAGLPMDFWSDAMRAFVYEVENFSR